MNTKVLKQEVLLFEGIGFVLVLALLWLNEALDFPHRLLGAPQTPLNWRESVLESVVVLGLGAATLSWTHHALARIRYLEGFIRVCMFCKRVQTRDEWVPIEVYVIDHSEAVVSHSMCPECRKRHHPELLKEE